MDTKEQYKKDNAHYLSTAHEVPSKIKKFSGIFKPDDLLNLYKTQRKRSQNLPNNHDLKQRDRSPSERRIGKVKEYCKNAI